MGVLVEGLGISIMQAYMCMCMWLRCRVDIKRPDGSSCVSGGLDKGTMAATTFMRCQHNVRGGVKAHLTGLCQHYSY